MSCTVCFKPATVRVYGKYKNGVEVEDKRCATHAPELPIGPVEGRQWAFVGRTNRLFQMTDIDTVGVR